MFSPYKCKESQNVSLFSEKNIFFVVFLSLLRLIGKRFKTMNEKERAYSDLIKRHKNTIFTVCYLFSKGQEEANDLFQETLINLWRGFDSFQGKCDVKTWIWRVSFNTCLTFERKKKRSVETVPFNMDINLFSIVILLVTGFSAQGFSKFFIYLIIAIFSSVLYFVIGEVFVKPDVELTLEQVLHDLEVQPNEQA